MRKGTLNWRIRCFLEDQAVRLGSRMARSRPVKWMARLRAGILVARITPIVWSFVADQIWWPAKHLVRRGFRFVRVHNVLAWIATWAICAVLGYVILLPYTIYLRLAEGVLAGVAFVIISIRSPLTGLLLWLATSPLLSIYMQFKFVEGTPVVTGSRFCLVILLAVYLFRPDREPRSEKNFRLHAFMALFIVGMLVATLPAENPKWAAEAVMDIYLMPVLVYLFARRWVTNRRSLSIVFVILLFVGIYFAGLAIPEHFTGKNWFTVTGRSAWIEEELGTVRVQGPAESPTEFGVVLMAAMMLALVKMGHDPRSRSKFLYAVAIALMAYGVYLTLRRSIYVGAVLALVGMLFTSAKPRRITAAMLIVLVFATAIGWQAIVNSRLYSVRIKEMGPIYGRAVIQATTWNIIRHHPVYGIGLNRFGDYKKSYLVPYKDIRVDYGAGIGTPHNSYLRIMVESGAVGSVPFFGMIIFMLATSIRAWKRCREGGLLGRDGIVVFWVLSAVFLSQSFQEDTFWYCTYASALWFFYLGAIVGVHLQKPMEPVPERQSWRTSLSRSPSRALPARH